MADIPVVAVKEYKSNFRRFGGADFTSVPTQVAAHRSPDMCNMIANEKFFPVKRPGYRVEQEYGAKIWGLHRLVTDDGVKMLVHSGDKLYVFGQTDAVCTGMNTAHSRSFVMNGKLYLLDGLVFRQVWFEDGVCHVCAVSDAAFVPTTSIARTPDGAGTAFEPVNLLTRRRKNSFCADGRQKRFQLDMYPVSSVESVSVNGLLLTAQMDTGTGNVIYAAENAPEGADIVTFTVDLNGGAVAFAKAPESAGGADNVVIAFTAGEDHTDRINKCRVCGMFGGNNDTRVFLSGNSDLPNVDFQSGLYDPTYFPDTGYTKIGADTSAIMGYARQYDTQIVIKEGNGQDATQWLRTFSLDGENKPRYAVAQGAVGQGAVSRDAFDVLGDSPLFLSQAGVCAVAGTTVSQQRTVQNRSMLIGKRLKEEADENACAAVCGNKYYLSCGGHVYVADGAQMYEDDNGVAQYEWYYWEGFAPTAMLSLEGRLWFGLEDGKVCTLGQLDELTHLTDDGKAFACRWTTPLQSLNSLYRTKTVRDVSYMLMPYSQAQYKVYYRSDRRDWILMREGSLSMFDFDNFNFGDLSFFCSTTPITERTRRKERRAEVFQVKVENDALGTQMGLLGIEITYRYARKTR